MNETDDAIMKTGADPLSDAEYAVPAWAEKIVDQLANQITPPSLLQRAVRYCRIFAVFFALASEMLDAAVMDLVLSVRFVFVTVDAQVMLTVVV